MAFDAYLKIDGIAGESTAAEMTDTVEIQSFSFGASNPVTIGSGTGGISGGRVSISEFSIMKKTDKASADLFLAACIGKHIPTMTLSLRKQGGTAGQQVFLSYEFTEVMVSSIQWSGSNGGDDAPAESVSFAFAKLHVKYSGQKPDGSFGVLGESTWDQTTVAPTA